LGHVLFGPLALASQVKQPLDGGGGNRKETRMHLRTLALLPLVMGGVLLSPGIATADTVGTPGTPNCFGQRVSHGSSDHGLTPVERTAGLQALVDEGFPEAVALFGPVVTVREWADFVRTNCSDTPIVPS
jgi:hypothetical protein